VYTALRADQSNNQRAIYDVNQFTDNLPPLLHYAVRVWTRQEKDNANKSICKKTLEDGRRTTRDLCGNVDAALGSDDLGLNLRT